MFDLISIILDGIYGILVAVVGLLMLFGPYDKFKESYPKAPSKAVVKNARRSYYHMRYRIVCTLRYGNNITQRSG